MARAPRRDVTERVMALLENADPLERLRALLAVHDEAPAIRAAALDELLDAGWSKYAVSQELGISSQAVYKWPSR